MEMVPRMWGITKESPLSSSGIIAVEPWNCAKTQTTTLATCRHFSSPHDTTLTETTVMTFCIPPEEIKLALIHYKTTGSPRPCNGRSHRPHVSGWIINVDIARRDFIWEDVAFKATYHPDQALVRNRLKVNEGHWSRGALSPRVGFVVVDIKLLRPLSPTEQIELIASLNKRALVPRNVGFIFVQVNPRKQKLGWVHAWCYRRYQ